MLKIHPLMELQIDAMRILARAIWQTTYASLISQAQIDFMLGDRYAAARIRTQLDDPDHAWRLAWWDWAARTPGHLDSGVVLKLELHLIG